MPINIKHKIESAVSSIGAQGSCDLSLNQEITDPVARHRFFLRLLQRERRWRRVLYVHTPFCPSKCSYCIYNSTAGYSADDFQAFYREHLPEQINTYEHILEDLSFDEAYFGGGTPTIASPAILRDIFERIPNFDRIPVKSIEASPQTITRDHIELFAQWGFSYISLGVQSLIPHILERQNREVVTLERLKAISKELEDNSLIYNFDLICYLDSGGLSDLYGFEKELNIVLGDLRPISTTIHSHYGAPASREKVAGLLALIRMQLDAHPGYQCVNSLLNDEDIDQDLANWAEYRLMRSDREFYNYMWHRYPTMPVFGTNILSLGFRGRQSTQSNAGCVMFDSYNSELSIHRDYDMPVRDFITLRRKMGLPYPETWESAIERQDRL